MYKERIQRVLSRMKEAGLKQLLVSDPDSVFYLTGVSVEPYERMFAFLVRDDGHHALFLNRLFNVPETEYEEVWFSDTDDSVGMIAERIDRSGRLGIDKEWPARFLIPLMERCPELTVVLGSDCVDGCRAVKDAKEQKLMREASRINDIVNVRAREYVKAGMTEKMVADFIDANFVKEGAEGPSFTTIVSFGANAADPHHEPDDTVLKEGDCVLFDMGCVKDRYCSDMTRTFLCGETDDEEFGKVYELVRRANEKAERMIRPGIRFSDIDAAARDLIADAGYGEYFNHRLGHFIGQTDHEAGDVSSANENLTEPGMIFSIEPGIYLPGRFGVRIEDLVLVTEDGCEILNHVDKSLRHV
ncbi:MAG: Xaa-Pro peptidase family protein [Eubacteriales bacterium]|jgi:Xaa-Pro aminopeptidase